MKYIFYIETSKALSGVQKTLLNMAKAMSFDNENSVYYINHIYEADATFFKNTAVQSVDVSTVNPHLFENAVVFVPANYLFFLLTRIDNHIKFAKICLLAYDPTNLKRLFNQNAKRTSYNTFLAMLKKRNAVAFTNRLDYYSTCSAYGIFNEFYLPLIKEEQSIKRCNKLVCSKTVNIGYYSEANSVDILTITNFAERIVKLNRTNENVNIHVFGDSSSVYLLDFSKFSPYIKFIFPGKLSGDALKTYMYDNVDLVVANREYALFSASLRLPTILPIYSKNMQKDNRYVYFYDVNGYLYDFDRNQLIFANDKNYTIGKIIDDIYKSNQKPQIGQACYDSFMKYASYSVGAKMIKTFANSCKLTYQACIHDNYIKSQLQSFENVKKAFPELTYDEYFNHTYNVVKRVSAKDSLKASIKKSHLLYSLAYHYKYRQYFKVQRSFGKKKQNIRLKYLQNGKIRVAFIVLFNAVFPTRPIYEKMLQDSKFDPYIIVAPNISRTMKYQMDLLSTTYDDLYNEYGERVINAYDANTDSYLDLKDTYSIIFFNNPYKNFVHKYHDVEYFLDKDVLTLYSSYGFAALKFWDEVIATDFYNYLWKACVETETNLEHLQHTQRIKGINGVVTGYIKVDKLYEIRPAENSRKKVLICPHHTVWGWKTLNISNFLQYAELFVELPKLFPQIDFIFRPHPLLFANLKAHNIWTQQQIDEYMSRLTEKENMTYDNSGEYFQQFADSAAMIHDCGSFIGEYLYTENPCCYMMKSEKDTYAGLVPLGQQCMDQYYHAFSKEEIIDFIQNVVIDGIDPMKEQRESFVEKELKTNYPHAAEAVINMIKSELKIED